MEGMKKPRDGDGGGGRQRCSSDWREGGGGSSAGFGLLQCSLPPPTLLCLLIPSLLPFFPAKPNMLYSEHDSTVGEMGEPSTQLSSNVNLVRRDLLHWLICQIICTMADTFAPLHI